MTPEMSVVPNSLCLKDGHLWKMFSSTASSDSPYLVDLWYCTRCSLEEKRYQVIVDLL